MAKKPAPRTANLRSSNTTAGTADSLDQLLAAAQKSGSGSLETGRWLVTFKEGGLEEGTKSLKAGSMRIADSRDFADQAVTSGGLGDADAVVFPEIGVALVSGAAAAARSLDSAEAMSEHAALETVEPEYFVFSDAAPGEYLRGFLRAAETIARDLGASPVDSEAEADEQAAVLGATWGINACRVPPSTRNGLGIRVAVLDSGMDLAHPDFASRGILSASFVGQPVQDLNSHGTHCIGTSCGPQAPAGTTPRYGVAFRASIFAGKVLRNDGWSVGGSVLAGMNWAIANNCQVISMSLSGQSPAQAAYTNAGRVALQRGLLMIAAAGNEASPTGAPANSPTIMAVASLDPNLAPSSFSNFGKIDIAGPGRDVYSSVPMPRRYGFKSGTSMACPHVAGVAALWAQSNPALRGQALWNRLLLSARPLPFAAARVGRGLVQAP